MTALTGRRAKESVEDRLGRLEDIEAIKNLKSKYAHYCDIGYDADGFVTLFVDDATWESNAFGSYNGKDEIHGFIAETGNEILWALHYMVNPVIDVAEDGQTATGTFVLLEPATMTAEGDGRDAVVITAKYEDEFVKVGDEWRFKSVKAHFFQVSNLDQGWVRQQFRGE